MSLAFLSQPHAIRNALRTLALFCFTGLLKAEDKSLPVRAAATAVLAADLRVIETVISHYSYSGNSLADAAREVWLGAAAKSPERLGIRAPDQITGQTFTLALSNVSGRDVLDALAEIFACRWTVRGWNSDNVVLEFTPIEGIDDTAEMFYAEVFELNEEACRTLALPSKSESPHEAAEAALESYGVKWTVGGKRGFASYSGEKRLLIAAVPKDQLPLLRAVIQLAKAGKLRARTVP